MANHLYLFSFKGNSLFIKMRLNNLNVLNKTPIIN